MGVIGHPDVYTAVDLSPTGTRAVVVKGGSGWIQNRDLWLADLTSNMFVSFTSHPGLESSPSWSPDGGRIAYHSSQAGMISPFVKDLQTGREEQLFQPKEGVAVDDWTRSDAIVLRTSRGLLCAGLPPSSACPGTAVYALPVTGERKLQLLADTPYRKRPTAGLTRRSMDCVQLGRIQGLGSVRGSIPLLPDKRRVSVGGGVQPRWREDGRELFYLAPDGMMMVVPSDGSSRARRSFTTLLSPPAHQLSENDVTSNGQRFLLLEPGSTRSQTFTYLLNWSHAEE